MDGGDVKARSPREKRSCTNIWALPYIPTSLVDSQPAGNVSPHPPGTQTRVTSLSQHITISPATNRAAQSVLLRPRDHGQRSLLSHKVSSSTPPFSLKHTRSGNLTVDLAPFYIRSSGLIPNVFIALSPPLSGAKPRALPTKARLFSYLRRHSTTHILYACRRD